MSGVTSTGFVVQTEAEIFDAIAAEARATIAPELDVAPDSVMGQITAIVASKHAELWEVLEAVWGALSESASGAALDRIAALTGSRRKDGESDAAFRVRRRQELADQGATTQPALHAALSKLSGMEAVRVASNRTMAADTSMDPPRPAKSVECIVFGSTPENVIAQTIWQNLAAGVQAFGTITTHVTDSEGHTQAIGYSPATPANWFIRIALEVDEGSYAGTDALKQALIDFSRGAVLELTDGRTVSGGVDLGGILYRSRFAAAALTVPGVTAILQVQFKTDAAGELWRDEDLPLGARQYLGTGGVRGFVADHIEVVTR